MVNTYVIAKDVDVSKIENVGHANGTAFGTPIGLGKILPLIGLIPFGGMGIIAASLIANEIKKTNEPNRIETLDELNHYTLCGAREWKREVIYIEHPRVLKSLIEASLFKDYVLREMVADIANYIMDNMELKSLVIGLVDDKKIKGNVTVPVEQLCVNAKMHCNLHKGYTFSVNGTKPSKKKNTYNWIDLFPDIISAVEHEASSIENIKEVSMDLDGAIGIGKKIGLAMGFEKSYKFYINYAR